jgi:hypothetical protein
MARWGNRLTKGSASVQGVGYLNAAASNMRRFKLSDLLLGISQAPADNAFEWVVQRCTALPTGTTITPNATDPADTLASTIVATGTVTVDSASLTAGAFLLEWPVNQRASVRWVCQPYYELLCPATASNGFMIGFAAASTSTAGLTGMYEEL